MIPLPATSLMPSSVIPGVTLDVPDFEDSTLVDGTVTTFPPFHPRVDHAYLSDSLSELLFFFF